MHQCISGTADPEFDFDGMFQTPGDQALLSPNVANLLKTLACGPPEGWENVQMPMYHPCSRDLQSSMVVTRFNSYWIFFQKLMELL